MCPNRMFQYINAPFSVFPFFAASVKSKISAKPLEKALYFNFCVHVLAFATPPYISFLLVPAQLGVQAVRNPSNLVYSFT